MNATLVSSVLLASLITYAALAIQRSRRAKAANPRGLPLPPGPKPLPIIGNALDIPRSYSWLKFAEWTKDYGDIIHMKAFGRDFIILNSFEAVNELLEKRSSNYSCRPVTQMIFKIIGYEEWSMTFFPYGDKWKKYRKTIHQYFSAGAVNQYQDVITEEARKMLKRLLDKPDEYYGQFRLVATATILRITYGIDVTEPDDKYVTIAEDSMHSLSIASVPGKYLVDLFPIMKYIPPWVPGADFQIQGKIWRDLAYQFVNVPFDAMLSALARNERDATNSVAADLLNAGRRSANPTEGEEIARNIAAVAYAGGTETTASSFCSFFVAMVMHPDKQKRAQAELDRVLEGGRLPEFSDRPHLPYVEAIVKEVERWQPVTPMATPHKSVMDDEYKGYFIPKDAVIIGNAWAVSRDEKVYPDGNAFKPERFLKDDRMDPDMIDPNRFAFGFARRVCPGRYFAEQAMFITIASILACFEFAPAYDANGQPIPVKVECPDGIIAFPKPFKCTIRPRTKNVPSLIDYSLQQII